MTIGAGIEWGERVEVVLRVFVHGTARYVQGNPGGSGGSRTFLLGLTLVGRGYSLAVKHMETNRKALGYLLLVMALGMAGCGRQEEPESAGVARPEVTPLVEGDQPPATVRPMEEVEAQVKEVSEAAEAVKEEAVKQVAVAEAKLAELRGLIEEKRYAEASELLQELGKLELTQEQEQALERLKAELQKGLSGKAIEEGKKALGGLLEGGR